VSVLSEALSLEPTVVCPARVCLLTETYYPEIGGGESQARALARGLLEEDAEAIVLTRRSDAALPREETLDDVPVYRVGPAGPRHLNKWGLLLTVLPALLRLRDRYDLIFVSGYRVLGVPAVVAAWLLGKRCVLKADSTGEMSGAFFAPGLRALRLSDSSWIFRRLLALRNRVLLRADAFVAISSEIRRELLEAGVDAEAVHGIPNSVDVHRFRPVDATAREELRRRLGLPLGARIATYTGRLVSTKGLPQLLDAWRELQAGRDDLLLLLVGAGGLDIHDCEAELREFVRRHDLGRTVRFTGAVDNVADYLQASDLFVFPTLNEAFGISLIEAMSCGLPVIATPVGGVRDIVEHERDGLMVDVGRAEPLRAAMRRVLDDRGLAASLGGEARRTVVARYAEANVVRAYLQLFGTVLECAPRDDGSAW